LDSSWSCSRRRLQILEGLGQVSRQLEWNLTLEGGRQDDVEAGGANAKHVDRHDATINERNIIDVAEAAAEAEVADELIPHIIHFEEIFSGST